MRNEVDLVTHPLVCTEDGRGIRVLREDEVALVMDEHSGRVTVVTDAGEVLHRPGPLAAFEGRPWEWLTDDACGHPLHGVRVPGGYAFPGDWKVATTREMERGGASAPTREGRVRVGRRMVEPRRLHRIEGHLGKDRWRVYLRDPDEVFAVRGEGGRGLMALLGLTRLDRLEPDSPTVRSMYALGLRDHPHELMKAPASYLRAAFPTLDVLIPNAVWDTVRRRARGDSLDYGTDLRGYYYRPLLPIVTRAGLGAEPLESLELMMARGTAPLYQKMYETIEDMVARHRLMRYRDLGFVDPRPDRWRIGKRRPSVVLVVEKTSLAEEAFELAALFDVTVVVLGGTPQWVATEFFADALRPRLGPGHEVRVVALVDFDPGGWGLVDTVGEQLRRYAIAATDVRHLVRPERFTAEELEWVLRPLAAPNEQTRSRVRNWVKRSGGVNGKPYGIHADHFRGLERLRQAFHEETGL